MLSPTGPRPAVSAFPTAEETLALQAGLLDGDRAIDAWRKLNRAVPGEGPGIAWIAPLLMTNLKRLVPDDPWVKDNPHFLTLCQLQMRAILGSAQTTLGILGEASIPTMALKGLALGLSVYPSPDLRTVSDLDILVPVPDLFRAMEALKHRGFRAGDGGPWSAADLRGNHAHVFHPTRKHEQSIDLHWHVLASARGDDDDAVFWASAQPLMVGSAPTRALCPEDQLLHALVHGVRWTRMPHVRWVADAVLILRQTRQTFRVERFLEQAQRFDVVAPVQEGLRFVAEAIGEGQELFEQSKKLKRSRFSGRAFKARATAYEERSVTDRIALRVESALWSRRARRSARRTPEGT